MHFNRRSSILLASGLASHVLAANVSTLATRLKAISADVFPDLKDIAVDIWNNPEIGLDEHHAHDLVVDYFTTQRPGEWVVTPHAFGMPTAWRLEFEFTVPARPPNTPLPVIGFLSEYDALVGIGHACGHNHIALNGLAAASMARQAVIDLGIPARIVLMGTPDEESEAGKHTLLEAGAFDGVDVWFMAHPTSTSAVQPMNARINAIADFRGGSHNDVVRSAYEAIVAVSDRVAAGLPGTSSTAVAVEDVGMFECNVVQSQISLGINGSSLETVQQTVSSILDSTFPGVTFTAALDSDGGVNLTSFGPGGHASESTKGPLVLTVETFRALSSQQGVTFYLPGNTTATALDITFDVRSRFTLDLDSVLDVVTATFGNLAASISTDTVYPALEVTPFIPDVFIDLLKTPDYGSQTNWGISTFAPASTDASWLQGAVVDPTTKALIGADRVVFHPNFGICPPGTAHCAFNHEPPFRDLAGTDFSYTQTEIVARALAQIAVELLNDPVMMANATAILGN
ncbi:hypothetical protein B0T24DRAFT_532122 [Lasiosphaeria ovina]|uniref:Peptidase M20 dimerisation domain-containing protein n=1 Tax=Lasiosphaeria ovina TaxID=92902 RepID=A0AAE0K3Q7_9PEZI|nr:hypothetical protein B0T24DRAFT_532122 [Lasiosphaeria ovina]